MRKAASRQTAAVTANASSGLVAAISEPPAIAPTRKPALSIPVSTALETASCSGERASVGSSAACAGLIAVEAIVNTAASASTSANGAPSATARRDQRQACGAHERRLHHHVAARAAVGQQARHRRRERGREHPHQRRDADRRRPADVVGVDRQHDHERPRADRRRRPPELQPAQVAGAERGPQRLERIAPDGSRGGVHPSEYLQVRPAPASAAAASRERRGTPRPRPGRTGCRRSARAPPAPPRAASRGGTGGR